MSQDDWIILLLKIVLISGAVSVTLFVAMYHKLTRGGVWRNAIGQTLVAKDILLIACLVPSILSLFFSFNRLTSHIAAWADIALFGLITPVMLWRVQVWRRIHKNGDREGGR